MFSFLIVCNRIRLTKWKDRCVTHIENIRRHQFADHISKLIPDSSAVITPKLIRCNRLNSSPIELSRSGWKIPLQSQIFKARNEDSKLTWRGSVCEVLHSTSKPDFWFPSDRISISFHFVLKLKIAINNSDPERK